MRVAFHGAYAIYYLPKDATITMVRVCTALVT